MLPPETARCIHPVLAPKQLMLYAPSAEVEKVAELITSGVGSVSVNDGEGVRSQPLRSLTETGIDTCF